MSHAAPPSAAAAALAAVGGVATLTIGGAPTYDAATGTLTVG